MAVDLRFLVEFQSSTLMLSVETIADIFSRMQVERTQRRWYLSYG